MVSLETINVGLASNDKKGDPLRNAMQKVNLNFTALNTAIQKVLDGKGQVNGYASLGADGRLAASQVPVPFAVNLPSGINLDTYVTPGTYHQNTNAGAAAGANYPSPHAGLLEVFAPGNATNFAYQFYTRFRSGGANQTRYWRTGYGTPLVWGNWAEFASSESGLMHYGFMPAAQDLDNYRTRGIWNVSTATIASGGTNFPIVQAGNFIVYAQVGQGQSPAGYVVQHYTAANANRTYTRVYSGTAWGPWVYNLDSSVLGVASGIPQLGSDTRLLPAQAPILYASVIVAGTDANAVVVPGCYYLNSDAQATAALNWPMLLAGTLMVEQSATGNAQVTQTYTTRNGTGGVLRTFKRVRFGTGGGTWGTWQELARYDDAMTHVYLTAATDANTLTTDNTFYTWSSSAVPGANFPGYQAGGSMQVFWHSTAIVSQELSLLVAGSKPLKFARYGNPSTGVWQPWKVTSPFSGASWMPSSDMGDIDVDGRGTYRWNGSAYARWTPDVPGDFTMLLSNARIRGNFVGGDVTGALALQASSGNHTRWNVVPPAGASPAAASAGVVFSLADSPNTAFMNINSNADGHHFQSGVSGTSSYRPIIFWQVNARCGALNTAATWEFGPATSYPVMARVAINYDGGVTRYGIVMRPNADDTRSFHFANAAGADCGSIQHSASATFFVTTSDYRIKSNVTDLPPEEGLGSVLRIRPRYFSMYGEDRLQRGFIAHELQEVIPEAVTGEKDAVYPAEAGSGPRMMLQGVDMSRIVPHLVAAIQALDTKLEAALARISELEG